MFSGRIAYKKYYILQIMYHPVGNLVNETVQTVHNAILGI